MQVCLAAEKCGNLDFDVRNDMWNSSEGLYCNTTVHKAITFWDIWRKVCTSLREACSSSRQPPSVPASFDAPVLTSCFVAAFLHCLVCPSLCHIMQGKVRAANMSSTYEQTHSLVRVMSHACTYSHTHVLSGWSVFAKSCATSQQCSKQLVVVLSIMYPGTSFDASEYAAASQAVNQSVSKEGRKEASDCMKGNTVRRCCCRLPGHNFRLKTPVDRVVLLSRRPICNIVLLS